METACLIAILALALLLRMCNLTEPFDRMGGWSSINAFFAIPARHFVELGYLETRFAPITDQVRPENGDYAYYMHHPPLFPLILSLSFHLFGVHEWSARLVAILASLIELVAIWYITRMLFGRRAALAAAALGAAVPGTAYYGTHLCQNGSVLFAFAAVAFALHLRYLERPSRGLYAGLLLTLAGAALTDWPGYHFMAAVVLHFLWCGKKREALWITGLIVALPVLHLLHCYWVKGALGGSAFGNLQSAFAHRSWGDLERYGGLRVAVPAILHHFPFLYTWPVILLAFIGLARIRRAARPAAVVALMLAGSADLVIFLEGAARHEFWINPMAPAILALAGAGTAGLSSLVSRRIPAALILAALVMPGMILGALETCKRYADVRSDYSRTLGSVINEYTTPDERVGTCEANDTSLKYYARRRVTGKCSDALIPPEGLPPSFPLDKIVIPDRKHREHEHERLKKLLMERHPYVVVETDACGKVYIFQIKAGGQ